MTPEESAALSASLFQQHANTMQAIVEKGVRQSEEWSLVAAKLVDKFSTGELTIAGLVARAREDLAAKLQPASPTTPEVEQR